MNERQDQRSDKIASATCRLDRHGRRTQLRFCHFLLKFQLESAPIAHTLAATDSDPTQWVESFSGSGSTPGSVSASPPHLCSNKLSKTSTTFSGRRPVAPPSWTTRSRPRGSFFSNT